jgi:Flp pilus assembly protein TadG
MVEMAVVILLFLFLVWGVVEGGRLIYCFVSVSHAAQEGGRLAVLASTPNVDAVKARAVEAAAPLPVAAGNVTVTVNGGATSFGDRALGDRIEVTASYEFEPVIGYMFPGKTTITLTGRTEIMVE